MYCRMWLRAFDFTMRSSTESSCSGWYKSKQRFLKTLYRGRIFFRWWSLNCVASSRVTTWKKDPMASKRLRDIRHFSWGMNCKRKNNSHVNLCIRILYVWDQHTVLFSYSYSLDCSWYSKLVCNFWSCWSLKGARPQGSKLLLFESSVHAWLPILLIFSVGIGCNHYSV